MSSSVSARRMRAGWPSCVTMTTAGRIVMNCIHWVTLYAHGFHRRKQACGAAQDGW